ncbi:MAG: DUF4355 domain-containing protein [Clostridiales bacterium]|nr:DUF4355 domain-containing protein [Clostridiales bacterium]
MNEEERREEQQEPMEPPAPQPEQGPVLMRQVLEAERKALDEEKAAFAAQRLEDAVGRELASRGLPTAFARFLTGQDEAQALEQVELFEALFRESLAQAVTERMRGTRTPREPAKGRSYSRESLRGMSRREINDHWEEITKALAR